MVVIKRRSHTKTPLTINFLCQKHQQAQDIHHNYDPEFYEFSWRALDSQVPSTFLPTRASI